MRPNPTARCGHGRTWRATRPVAFALVRPGLLELRIIEPPEVSLVQYPDLANHIDRMQWCGLPDALSGV